MLKPKNITLERVKQSNYWNLLSIIVWNHYNDKKYQNEDLIEIKEQWCGINKEGGSHHCDEWNNPNFRNDFYVRTLNYIKIILKTTDHDIHIIIKVKNGNVHTYNTCNYKYHYGTTDVTNWMLENDLLEYVS